MTERSPRPVETIKQLAERTGLSKRTIRSIIQSGELEHVCIVKRKYVPEGAFERYVDRNTVRPCRDETKVPSCVGSPNVGATTSPGPSMAAAASARLALQTANELKKSLGNGCTSEAGGPAQVIPLKCS
jgi:excisionase family DNA binding protein